ncbi:MAG: hypothetical protein ABJH04_07725 [Cyclobacteriaceae bacterium]
MKFQVQAKNLDAGDRMTGGVVVQSPPTNLGHGQVAVKVMDSSGNKLTQVFNLRSYVSLIGDEHRS